MAKARVQMPAPHWKGMAVMDDDFEEISLDHYRGQHGYEYALDE